MVVKKASLFGKIYFIIVGICLILLAASAIILSSILKSYEKTRPVHLAEEIFENYFKKGDYEGALKLSSEDFSSSENISQIAEALKNKYQGKELILYSVTAEDGKAAYAVAAVDKIEESTDSEIPSKTITSSKIAIMTFAATDKKASWGFKEYGFESMKIEASGDIKAKIKAPVGMKISVNGIAIPEESAISTEESEYNSHLHEGAKKLSFNYYEISGLFKDPKITAEISGEEKELEFDEAKGMYIANIEYDAELQKKYSDRVLKGIESAAAFIQADVGINAVAPYFDTSSAYYKEIRSTPNQYVWDHNGYLFENEICDEFYAYSDSVFSCHVSFKHILKKTGKEDFIDFCDMTVFCKKDGGEYKIYDHIVR